MDEKDQMRYILKQQILAYNVGPSGSWFERFIPGICKHLKIRCTHGDEIIHRRYRRKICMVCGRSLKGPMPARCFFTGTFH